MFGEDYGNLFTINLKQHFIVKYYALKGDLRKLDDKINKGNVRTCLENSMGIIYDEKNCIRNVREKAVRQNTFQCIGNSLN